MFSVILVRMNARFYDESTGGVRRPNGSRNDTESAAIDRKLRSETPCRTVMKKKDFVSLRATSTEVAASKPMGWGIKML
jgi:hypothetical protein